MSEFGAAARDGTACGARSGYPYTVELFDARAPELTFRFVLAQDAKPARELLKKEPGAHTRWYSEPDSMSGGGILVAVLRPPSDFYAKAAVHGVLGRAAETLKAMDLTPPEECPLCGNPGCDVHALLGACFRPAHKACLDTRLSLPEEDVVKPVRLRGFYLTGILGAVLGALIGGLPNFALALNEGRINAPLYAFIPILSALVYRLLRGKASRTYSNIVVLAASLGSAFLLELVWYWLVQATPLGYMVSFWATSAQYFATHTFALTLREMLFSLISLAVGCIPAAFVLKGWAKGGRTGGETVRGAKYVRESAAPIRPPDEDPPYGDGADADFLGAGI